ncbi:hypothetical protein [Pedobacter sp. R-06]|uniref:hypothetical protein n=1 Tax=Pedobacter sp. R-06 TaxID=3404051 RepID=UPI003CEDFA7F
MLKQVKHDDERRKVLIKMTILQSICNNNCVYSSKHKAYIMNSFEEYTLIIGAIAVLIEAVKYFKKNFRSWFEHT